MTTHQKLSSLSIATIALLAAAVPCLAQGQSRESRSETVSTITVVEPTLALNRTNSGTRKSTPATAPTASANQPKFSLNMFKQSDKFSANEAPRFMTSPANVYEPKVDPKDKQFRDVDSSSRRLSFVPSRGQTLPNRENPSRQN